MGYVFLQGLALSIHELCPFQLEIVVDRKVTDRHGQPVLCAFCSRTVCSLPFYGLAAWFSARSVGRAKRRFEMKDVMLFGSDDGTVLVCGESCLIGVDTERPHVGLQPLSPASGIILESVISFFLLSTPLASRVQIGGEKPHKCGAATCSVVQTFSLVIVKIQVK